MGAGRTTSGAAAAHGAAGGRRAEANEARSVTPFHQKLSGSRNTNLKAALISTSAQCIFFSHVAISTLKLSRRRHGKKRYTDDSSLTLTHWSDALQAWISKQNASSCLARQRREPLPDIHVGPAEVRHEVRQSFYNQDQ